MIHKSRVDELKRRVAWLEKINLALVKRMVFLNNRLSKLKNKIEVG
jgi:hypothetical protein